MRCDYCGMDETVALQRGLHMCAPPFERRPHEFTGQHPADRREFEQTLSRPTPEPYRSTFDPSIPSTYVDQFDSCVNGRRRQCGLLLLTKSQLRRVYRVLCEGEER